ncbi:MAG: hypothetical protein LBF15_06680, partial [Candidatus Peribacteria bacterium]|nr:hypothetical protein [Candidatus Peribacteria bacterium]
ADSKNEEEAKTDNPLVENEVTEELSLPEVEEETQVIESNEPKLETKEELDEFTKLRIDDDKEEENTNIPDWLK